MSDLTESAEMLSRRLRESAPPDELIWSQVAVPGQRERDGAMTVTQRAAKGVRTQSRGATVVRLTLAEQQLTDALTLLQRHTDE